MLTKIKLFYQIRKFYNIFGDEVGNNFITKLSDVTQDNVYDVLFDINEVFDAYDNDNTDKMTVWINKFRTQIIKFYTKEPITLVDRLLNICTTKNGRVRPYTKPIYKLAQYLYKKGVR